MRSLNKSRRRVRRVFNFFREFARLEASGGIVLLAMVAIALFWANSPWADVYNHLWETELTIRLGNFHISHSLHSWINDGLMAIFFFVVGLEIKREAMAGELNSPRQAALPVIAAIGGMAVPAVAYLAVNWSGEGARGWGIPMATDIALSLGVLALLGPRVPVTLKVFLTALAIVDDMGAVLVIALFYSSEVVWVSLASAAAIFGLLILINRLGIRQPLFYAVLGVALWFALFQSGIHATIAGILCALTIPAQSRIHPEEFVEESHRHLADFQKAPYVKTDLLSGEQQWFLQQLERSAWRVETTLQRLEHVLHPWNTYVIVPLFALSNAGVTLSGNLLSEIGHPVSIGVILGLFFGKPIGITVFTWIAVRLGLGNLPRQVNWRQIIGMGWLAGIGFTMSLFINSLAFISAEMQDTAKVGIITASIIAGLTGWLILKGARKPIPILSVDEQDEA